MRNKYNIGDRLMRASTNRFYTVTTIKGRLHGRFDWRFSYVVETDGGYFVNFDEKEVDDLFYIVETPTVQQNNWHFGVY